MARDSASRDDLGSGGEDMALDSEGQERAVKLAFLSRKLYLRIFTILIVIGITATIFSYRDRVANLETYGYLGAFLIALVTTATIILPVPGILLIATLGTVPEYNPVLVGLAAGAGSALGEITGYMAGFSGQVVFQRSRVYLRLERWMRWRGALVIFVLSFVPNPIFDLAGGAAGVLRYPLWRFLVVCFLGKTVRYILVACFGWFVGVSWF